MKKALPVLVVAILGITAHLAWYPDVATVLSHFFAGQIAQGLVDPSPSPIPTPEPPISADIPPSTILVLVIAGVATLAYVGYTWGDSFKQT